MRITGSQVRVMRDDVGPQEVYVHPIFRDAAFLAQRPKDSMEGKPSGAGILEGVGSAGAGVKGPAGFFRDDDGWLHFWEVLLVVEDLPGLAENQRLEVVLRLAWFIQQDVEMPWVLIGFHSPKDRMLGQFFVWIDVRQHAVLRASSVMASELMLPHPA